VVLRAIRTALGPRKVLVFLKRYGLALACLGAAIWLWWPGVRAAQGQGQNGPAALFGFVVDEQGHPIANVEIDVFFDDLSEPVAVANSHRDGLWEINLPRYPEKSARISFDHTHFRARSVSLDEEQVLRLQRGGSVSVGETVMSNRYAAGFWVAGATFLLVLILMAAETMPSATVALLGVAIIFASTFFGGRIFPSLYIFDFERALTYINWEVIFLVMGMMIVVGAIESTGLFQWLAFQSYRWSRGRPVVLVIILVTITALASAFLDNVTTMLLMVPISLEIAVALGLPPQSLLIPEIFASNIGGIMTLIGTPTNILIGAQAGISFNDFLLNQMAGGVLALVVMVACVLWFFRHDYAKAERGISPSLYARLARNAAIKDVLVLRKSLLVFVVTIVLFALGEPLHMVPAVTALLAATVILVWVETDVEMMINLVDWTTLVFFMALFMVVGAIQEVGLIGAMAGIMSQVIGSNLYIGVFVVVLGGGLLSFVVASIPLTAAMLPVVEFISGHIPSAATSKILYYGLSMGMGLGGNGLLIGGETNLMTAGVADRAGYRVTFASFARVGIPTTLLSLLAGSLWLLLRFKVLGGG